MARTALAVLTLVVLLPLVAATAEEGKPMTPGKTLPAQDRRLAEVQTLNTHYTFVPFQSKEAWVDFAKELRTHILVSTGLWPLPERTPLNAKVSGRVERGDYSIEKAYFESYPGFFCTGNLYRPLGKKGPSPGIINPHGHWKTGRLENTELGSIPARCINFAKQGCVAFAYDMVGYNDSKQITHRSFIGPPLEIWGLSEMGLQLWNSIRAIDFLQSLPDVDPNRIGCTGASGGGTQTFMVTAVDDRIKVAAPVNMISATMQGGCVCENAPNLRIDAFNVHIAGLTAPRALLMVSATGDWTKNTPKEEFPAVQSIYRLLGAEDKVYTVQIDAPHNYNKDSREAVYAWFGKWFLGQNDPTKLKEQAIEPEKPEDMLCFPDGKLPGNALTREQVISYLVATANAKIEDLKPKKAADFEQFGEVLGTSFRHSLAAEVPKPGSVLTDIVIESLHGSVLTQQIAIGRQGKGDRVPGLLFRRSGAKAPLSAALIVHPNGKAALAAADRKGPGELVTQALTQVDVVLTLDCFLTGDSQAPPSRAEEIKKMTFFTTYNRADLANRVQDILTGLAFLRDMPGVKRVCLVGLDKAGLWCLLARGLAPFVDSTVVDAARFDATSDESFIHDLFAPGIRRAGDVRTAAALAAPGKLFIHNAGSRFPTEWVEDVYRAAGAERKLRIRHTKAPEEAIVSALGG